MFGEVDVQTDRWTEADLIVKNERKSFPLFSTTICVQVDVIFRSTGWGTDLCSLKTKKAFV